MRFNAIPATLGDMRLPVVAYVPDPDRPSSIAICDKGAGKYVTYRVFHHENEAPKVGEGHYDQTPERALYDLADRAGLLTLAPAIDLQLTPDAWEQVRDLSAGCLNVTPVNHDWTDEDDEGHQWWEAFKHTDDNDQTWTLVVCDGSVVGLRIDKDNRTYQRDEYDDFSQARFDEYGLDPDAIDDDTPLPVEWLSSHEFEALFELSLGDESFPEGPMMSYWYPVEYIDDEDDAALAATMIIGTPLCVVEVDGEYGLALTGGGQDMTWEICEAFIALGQLPPVHYARDLPGIAGRGSSDTDRVIVAACLRSLEVARSRLVRDTERLTERARRWARDAR